MEEVLKTETTDIDTDFTDNKNGEKSVQDKFFSDDTNIKDCTDDAVATSSDIDDDLIYNIIPINETEMSKIEDEINVPCPTLENFISDDDKESVSKLELQVITVDNIEPVQIDIKSESDVDDDVLTGHNKTNQVIK